ncbi:Cytosolic Fe-S cluster assembly factor NAR1 [Hypsizygus marmoreus]|uniref:Cytosolic Fe-S cluster assembly factor NAR1 n=1 Tax=Hypsizygus marmoreus TaxID=39966 RepID=A0A369JD46_HYPMA|nr:Cytosolic Fe-S cluster assembly factor NAR1 [Hypsizygus marmoreus]
MAFSGALTLTDLNDFITPSQACIKPVQQLNKPDEKDPAAAATEIHIDRTGAYYEVPQDASSPSTTTTPAAPKKLEQAQINLNDCLACSGCITSAESVLITLQSHTEVLAFLESNQKRFIPSEYIEAEPYRVPVISISPQSIASLAAAISSSSSSSSNSTFPPPTPRQILRRLRAFCTESLGFACVFDTTFARHLALREHVTEFQERWTAAGQSIPSGATTTNETAQGLPMLASACPGWICYAEKAHSEMLPFIARTKSPQQVMGTLVKSWMGARWGKSPPEIYHVTVMPCYDKKLEASRTDFYNSLYSTRDVDCVITTGELSLLLHSQNYDITLPVPGEADDDRRSHSLIFDPFSDPARPEYHPGGSPDNMNTVPPIYFPEMLTHPGTSSGSYLHAVIEHVRSTSRVPLTLTVSMIRNTDYEEFVLSREEDGAVVFKGAKCYGFRNLQNVVRRVGRERGVRTTTGAAGKMAGGGGVRRLGRRGGGEEGKQQERGYDYVEVMACPGGCVNGGGQLKPVLASEPRPPVVDAEGYKRNWEDDGVALTTPAPAHEPAPLRNGAVDVTQNARWGSKEWTRRVEEEYWRGGGGGELDEMRIRQADGLVRRICDDVCGFGDDLEREESRRRHFRTQYRAVESEVIGLAVVW